MDPPRGCMSVSGRLDLDILEAIAAEHMGDSSPVELDAETFYALVIGCKKALSMMQIPKSED